MCRMQVAEAVDGERLLPLKQIAPRLMEWLHSNAGTATSRV